VLRIVVRALWWSYRVEKVIGEEYARMLKDGKTLYAPCLWHGQLILCAMLVFRWNRETGYKPCFVISASVDGDVPTALTEGWGGKVIRGSSNNTGALVLREMRRMFRDGYPIFTAADGPNGPNREFKSGVALMARVCKVPMMPIAFAADRSWHLRRWDNFMIPKPFARIVMAFGEPVQIPESANVRELEPWREQMENAVNRLDEESNAVFAEKSE
jgi:lysophospholipid acyltransferase (LPLAT)-like uncharacterized protein